MKKGLILVLALFMALGLKGQPPSRFYTTFGGEGDDVGYSGKVTLDKQYIIAGSTSSFGLDNTDIYLVKVNSMGQGIWQKHFGGIGNDVGKAVIQLADSGFVISGYTSSYGAGGYDAYLVKTDKNGNFVWQKTFGGADWDFANDLVLGSDGNIFVVGYTQSFGSGKKDGFVLKYDVSGNLLSQKLFGGTGNDELRSIIKTIDGNLATVGYTESRGDINGDVYLSKISVNLDTIYTRINGGSGKDYGNDLLQRPDGELVVCGAKTYSTDPYTHSLMYGYLESSDTLWENHYNSSLTDEEMFSVAQSFQILKNSAYLRNVPVPSYKTQGNVIEAKPQGWPYLVNSYGGYEEEFFYSLEGTEDGGYISVGWTKSYNALAKDVFFIKLDSTVINYESIVSIAQVKKAEVFRISRVSESQFFLNFSSDYKPEKMYFMELDGRELKEFNIKDTNFNFNLEQFPKGVYLVRFEFKGGNYTQRMIVNQ